MRICLADTIPKLLNGELTPIKQDEAKATFASNIKRSDEKIDWTKTGEEIYNHVRGLNPWPVSYTLLEGKVIENLADKKGNRLQES